MNRHDSLLIQHALEVLDENAKDFKATRSVAVKLALRVLYAHISEPRDLIGYWNVADNPNPTQRRHNLLKVLAVIRAQVGRRM